MELTSVLKTGFSLVNSPFNWHDNVWECKYLFRKPLDVRVKISFVRQYSRKTNKNTSPLCMLKTENTEINYLCSANDLVVWVMFEGVTTLDYIMRWDSIFRFAPMNLGFSQKQWANHLLTTLTSWDMKPFVLVSSVYQNPDWLVMAGWNTT